MNKQIVEQAVRKLNVLFESECNLQESDKIRAWFASQEHREEKDEALKIIWEAKVQFNPHPDDFALKSLEEIRRVLKFPEKAVKIRRFRSRTSLFRAAAVLVPLLAISLASYYFVTQQPIADQGQAQAEQPEVKWITAGGDTKQHVILPDGSEVWINRLSTIEYPENFETSRVVRLNGEAYFSVVKDNNRSFTVESDNLKVKVLGTKFNMRSKKSAETSIVTLESGSVEVETKDNTVKMNPLEQLICNTQTGSISVREVSQYETAPWKDASLIFEGTSLGEAFQAISNFYGITFQVDDRLDMTSNLRVKFDENEDIEKVLYVIQQMTGNIDYQIENETVIIKKR